MSTINQTINNDGSYTLNDAIFYYSPRYGKTITVPAGRISDGATGAMDITSAAWWVHDHACLGYWDDGTMITNWQCSTILYDILKKEGRTVRAVTWRIGTFLFGGGQARKNGMFTTG